MIEKITIKYPDFDDLKYKINELVDAVNELQEAFESIHPYLKYKDLNKTPADLAENGKSSKMEPAENMQDENPRCPFCQQEYIIHKDDSCFGQQRCVCRNPNCEFDGWHFPVKLVSELIRTRKALDVALDWLEQVATPEKCDDDLCREFTKRKLAEIKTALEQKE